MRAAFLLRAATVLPHAVRSSLLPWLNQRRRRTRTDICAKPFRWTKREKKKKHQKIITYLCILGPGATQRVSSHCSWSGHLRASVMSFCAPHCCVYNIIHIIIIIIHKYTRSIKRAYGEGDSVGIFESSVFFFLSLSPSNNEHESPLIDQYNTSHCYISIELNEQQLI